MQFITSKFLKIITVALFLSGIFIASVALASGPAPCNDGTTGCGYIGSGGGGPVSSSSCTLEGQANQGGQTCDTSVMGTGIHQNDPHNNSSSNFDFTSVQGVIPSTVNNGDAFDSYTQLYPNMQTSVVLDPIDDGGSVTVGTATDSYYGCTCSQNDVSGTGCGASNSRTAATGISSPGDGINLRVINQCKPNDDMHSMHYGTYGGGSAEAYITDGAVQCYTAAYYKWQVDNGYIDSSNLGRDYVPDPTVPRCDYDGVPKNSCTITDFSADSGSTYLAHSNTGTTLRFDLAGSAQKWTLTSSTSNPSPTSGTNSSTSSTGALLSTTKYTLSCGGNSSSLTVLVADAPVISVSPATSSTVSADLSGNATLHFNFMNATPHSTTNVASSNCHWNASAGLDPTGIFISCSPATLSNP